jgi:hypothetical protein
MAVDLDGEVWRTKDGREWRIGHDRDVAWIEENTESGLAITSAIPPVFEAYATLELPETSEPATAPMFEGLDRHDAGVIAVLSEQTAAEPWWLGYLDTDPAADTIFADVRKVRLYADWPYVLIEAGAEQAATWRGDGWNGALPDLMFSADRSWLVSTLWDDDWTCIGGPRRLVDAFLDHPDLQHRVREIKTLVEDATPPGHIAR